ncbi:MAG: hypothetical protein GTO45_17240 [Candidatus Aminicenantes bacterium]|nr:hypothetical protein [Candidatus Aminicenantes bacterium]NIM80521.1 hypothetical protein [Candidatus Aminicenantes bacterium]NIN43753.1 hypothetical protein [Candidatus Aminicenantes bacterium]NIN86503.1 hypothetical protein [Candidatus Aminicenantes bacterium]NIO82765.1 hypothetical protein [Candidatus Aminicenantes bacterium]
MVINSKSNLKMGLLFLCFLLCCINISGDTQKEFFLRGAFYQDWMGLKSEGTELYHRLSSRLKLTFLNKPGDGWTVFIDIRNRFTPGDKGKNQLIIYDARLSYDKLKSRLFFSLGQMNLYDTAGIGVLTGGVIGFKLNKYLSLGGYAGLEPDVYNTRWDPDYNKFGFFIRFIGPGAKQFSLSFNRVGFNNQTERQFIYSSLLLPVQRLFVLYGNLEYELDSSIKKEDRLSRLFFNARVNLSAYVDITANFSSGRGLDYHRFLLEQSQDPTIRSSEIERFYYNETYGVRLSFKPVKSIRVFAAKRESEFKDREVKNHTTRFGVSLANILKTGISLYGSFNMNRGDASESDSYYISASRYFGRLSCSLSFANYYNGVRISGEGIPQVFHIPDRQTLSANVFLVLHRSLALSLDYAYSYQKNNSDQQFFVRLIYRK